MSSRDDQVGGRTLSRRGQVATELSDRWVRVEFSGMIVADSRKALLVWVGGRPPKYYLPREDVRTDLLVPSKREDAFPHLGRTIYWHLRVGDKTARDAVLAHPEPPTSAVELKDYFTFKWSAIDAWYEEEEQIRVHPRDPYTRVDILPSSRHVRVVVEGHKVAESQRPWILFETGLPPRYYLPPADVRMDLLEPSDSQTGCPYKGTASYYSLRIGDFRRRDFVWTYRDPLPESRRIKGLLCFYNEKVDLYIDGELQPRPETPFS